MVTDATVIGTSHRHSSPWSIIDNMIIHVLKRLETIAGSLITVVARKGLSGDTVDIAPSPVERSSDEVGKIENESGEGLTEGHKNSRRRGDQRKNSPLVG